MATRAADLSDDRERAWAWEYYKHADTIHSRHGVFLVAHSVMLAAFATLFVVATPSQQLTCMLYVLAASGVLLSALWFIQSQRLSDGMSVLSNEYLDADPVYAAYLRGLRRCRASPSGRITMNILQPTVFATIWLAFGIAHHVR